MLLEVYQSSGKTDIELYVLFIEKSDKITTVAIIILK